MASSEEHTHTHTHTSASSAALCLQILRSQETQTVLENRSRDREAFDISQARRQTLVGCEDVGKIDVRLPGICAYDAKKPAKQLAKCPKLLQLPIQSLAV